MLNSQKKDVTLPGLGEYDYLIYFTAMSVSSVPDPALFSWDFGQILLQKTTEKEVELKKNILNA